MRIILTLISAFVLGACAPLVTIDTIGCEKSPRNTVKINYQKNSNIRVDKSNLEATQGDAILYKVIGDRSRKVNFVGVGDSSWLSTEVAANTGNGKIRFGYVCVKDDQDPTENSPPYTYKVVIDGVGELDPEVSVRRRNR